MCLQDAQNRVSARQIHQRNVYLKNCNGVSWDSKQRIAANYNRISKHRAEALFERDRGDRNPVQWYLRHNEPVCGYLAGREASDTAHQTRCKTQIWPISKGEPAVFAAFRTPPEPGPNPPNLVFPPNQSIRRLTFPPRFAHDFSATLRACELAAFQVTSVIGCERKS